MSEKTTLVAEQMSTEPASEAAPVTGVGQINSIHMLRGIAVAGILVMNVHSFGLYGTIPRFTQMGFASP